MESSTKVHLVIYSLFAAIAILLVFSDLTPNSSANEGQTNSKAELDSICEYELQINVK